VYGNDPNWGRVTAALGRSGAQLEEEKLDVFMGTIQVLKDGAPVPSISSKRSMFQAERSADHRSFEHGTANATAWDAI